MSLSNWIICLEITAKKHKKWKLQIIMNFFKHARKFEDWSAFKYIRYGLSILQIPIKCWFIQCAFLWCILQVILEWKGRIMNPLKWWYCHRVNFISWSQIYYFWSNAESVDMWRSLEKHEVKKGNNYQALIYILIKKWVFVLPTTVYSY